MDTFCDIIVTCGSVVFPLHLFILASKSTYFKKEFCHIDGEEDVDLEDVDSFNSKSTEKIYHKIDDIEPDIFQDIISYIYTGKCKFLVDVDPFDSNLLDMSYQEASLKSPSVDERIAENGGKNGKRRDKRGRGKRSSEGDNRTSDLVRRFVAQLDFWFISQKKIYIITFLSYKLKLSTSMRMWKSSRSSSSLPVCTHSTWGGEIYFFFTAMIFFLQK